MKFRKPSKIGKKKKSPKLIEEPEKCYTEKCYTDLMDIPKTT